MTNFRQRQIGFGVGDVFAKRKQGRRRKQEEIKRHQKTRRNSLKGRKARVKMERRGGGARKKKRIYAGKGSDAYEGRSGGDADLNFRDTQGGREKDI